jgi:hypothetical protein
MINDGIVGLCLMVESDEDAVFINIVGDIDPGALGRLGRKFNIVPLEDLGLENF